MKRNCEMASMTAAHSLNRVGGQRISATSFAVIANKSRICLSTSRLRCSSATHGCHYFSLLLDHKRRIKDELIAFDAWSPQRGDASDR
jgi:hypothetical protein